jgi:hypothetical protein
MPKIKQEESFEDEDESQFEEDEETDDDELEQEEQAKPKNKGMKRPIPSPARQGLPKNVPQPAPASIKRRYGVAAVQPVRIVDVESNEIIAEGDYLIAQALTDIIERLERIENTVGSMIEG